MIGRFLPRGLLLLRYGVGFFEPAGIDQIIPGYAVYLAGDEVYRDILDLPGGRTAINGPFFYPGALEYHSPRGNDGIAADLGIIHDDGPHANQHFVMYGTP